jgi:hypothetical protein
MNLQIEYPAAHASRRPEPASGFRAQLPLALFDQIECGLIVCDERGAIHFANHAAGQELASQHLLQRQSDTLNRAPSVTGDLEGALRLALQRGRRGRVRLAAAESSKAWARPMSRPSLQARPKNERPIGNPKIMPAARADRMRFISVSLQNHVG